MLEQQRSPGRFVDLAPGWFYLRFALARVAVARRIARPRAAPAVRARVAALGVHDVAPSRRPIAAGGGVLAEPGERSRCEHRRRQQPERAAPPHGLQRLAVEAERFALAEKPRVELPGPLARRMLRESGQVVWLRSGRA